jgi:DNA/RNA endonuclease YhcR with UshA esterase domain
MKKLFNYLFIGLVSIFIISSCVDNTFDEPEFPFKDPDLTTNTTIKEIKALHSSGSYETIDEDLIFSAVVIANDSTGNFYKKIVVQDETAGIEILIDGRDLYGKYPIGRRVFVKAKSLVIGDDNGVVQLAALVSEGNMVPIAFKELGDFVIGGSLNNPVVAKEMKIGQFSDDDISTLVKFTNVQFDKESVGKTFADGIAHSDKNRTLVDCSKKEFIVRTSGYAEFANDTIPGLNGELTCILGKYRSDYQGYIRSVKDVNFYQERCGESTGDETLITIRSVRDMYASGQTTMNDKVKISGVVISDKNAANLDGKNMVLQDATAGIAIRFNAAHDFELNDQVEIIISNLELSEYNKLLQFNGISLDLVNKTGSGIIEPKVATVNEILSNNEAWESTLVKIKDAQITGGSVYKDYDVVVKDATGSIDMYTRSLSTFANEALPSGDVDVTAIVGQYKDTYQIYIRNLDDVVTAGGGGGGGTGDELFSDDFEAGIGKWNAVNVLGDQVWGHDEIHGHPGGCAKMSGYDGSAHANEDWLITPQLDFTSVANPVFKFDNATNYDGNPMELYISTDYSGAGDPNSASWTQLTFNKSSGSWSWVSSGNIDLTSYAGQKVYVGFKFTSGDDKSATWEVDNVVVK